MFMNPARFGLIPEPKSETSACRKFFSGALEQQ
jgi:hypothetical protein